MLSEMLIIVQLKKTQYNLAQYFTALGLSTLSLEMWWLLFPCFLISSSTVLPLLSISIEKNIITS